MKKIAIYSLCFLITNTALTKPLVLDNQTPSFSFLVSLDCWIAGVEVAQTFENKGVELAFRPFSDVQAGASGYGHITVAGDIYSGSSEAISAINHALSGCAPNEVFDIKRDGTEWKELQKLVEQVETEGKEIVDISLSPISVIVFTRPKKEN